MVGLRDEELPSSRRQYVSLETGAAPYFICCTWMLTTWLALVPVATSSGGRRTGPTPQLDSSGGVAKQQPQSPTGGAKPAFDTSAESLDSRKEAAEALAARYRASRERLHEGGRGSDDVDVVGA